MSTLPARRAFLRGRSTLVTEVRPPWSLHDADFLDRCTRCQQCIEACPTQIIVVGDGGFPSVDFTRGECTFCADCVHACEAGAFGSTEAKPWSLQLAIADSCLAAQNIFCIACVDACPEQAIRLRYTNAVPVPQVDASACVACGACIAVCPSSAIRMTPSDHGADA